MSSNGWSRNATIRPVTTRFPASQDCLDQSSLPFACVVTPLAKDEHDDYYDYENQQGGSSKTATTTTTTTSSPSMSTTATSIVSSLTGIPKCPHCGAPHPDRTTHFSTTANASSPALILCYLCGRTFPFAQATTASSNNNNSNNNNNGSVFALPLRLAGTVAASNNSNNNNNNSTSRLSSSASALYAVPSLSCPPVWFVVLDGSTATDSPYWSAVKTVLMHDILPHVPDHVHVALLVASQIKGQPLTTITSTTKTNNNNNNKQQQPSNQQDEPATIDEEQGGELIIDDDDDDDIVLEDQECVLSIFQLYESPSSSSSSLSQSQGTSSPTPTTASTTTGATPLPTTVHHYFSDVTATRQDDLMQAVAQSLVPMSEPYKQHLLHAIQSLPHSTWNSHHHHHHNNNNKKSKNNSPSSYLPVGWTTQVLLAALQEVASPAGHRPMTNNNKDAKSSLLPYAGGKITFLLSNRPAELTSCHVPLYQPALSSSTTSTTTATTSPTASSVVGKGGLGGKVGPPEPGQRFGTEEEQRLYVQSWQEWTAHQQQQQQQQQNNKSRHSKRKSSRNDKSGTKQPTTNEEERNVASTTTTVEEYDWTPASLYRYYKNVLVKDVEEYFADLGQQCAEAALGVDVLALVDHVLRPEQDENDNINNNNKALVRDFGLALIQSLSTKSGAPGPLLFDVTDNGNDNALLLFARELQSRTPWQDGVVFGAELRLRVSPGFAVDPTIIGRDKSLPKAHPQLAPIMGGEAGLMGPATAVPESTHLWRMGTCDPHTSVTIDLGLQQRNVKTKFHVDGLGEVALKPVLQTCFAYTTIVLDPTTNEYKTVRQMKIASCPVTLSKDVEGLYGSLDPESLAVVLFHKLAVASLEDGIDETPDIAEQWLQSLLVSVYRSAEEQALLLQQRQDQGLSSDVDPLNKNSDDNNLENQEAAPFVPSERLLDRADGELSVEEVLLAQGHERLRTIPLMVYLLLQCDALRPLSKRVQQQQQQQQQQRGVLSLDLRCAAMVQMTSMTPTVLTRCIAPRLQLWESNPTVKEPIFDIIELRSKAVQMAVMESASTATNTNGSNLIFLLDSTDEIVVMDARYVNQDANNNNNGNKAKTAPRQVIGAGLQRVVEESALVYRTPPLIVEELDQSSTSGDKTFLRLLDVLIEDAPLGIYPNFEAWRSAMAKAVDRELSGEKRMEITAEVVSGRGARNKSEQSMNTSYNMTRRRSGPNQKCLFIPISPYSKREVE